MIYNNLFLFSGVAELPSERDTHKPHSPAVTIYYVRNAGLRTVRVVLDVVVGGGTLDWGQRQNSLCLLHFIFHLPPNKVSFGVGSFVNTNKSSLYFGFQIHFGVGSHASSQINPYSPSFHFALQKIFSVVSSQLSHIYWRDLKMLSVPQVCEQSMLFFLSTKTIAN